MRRKNISLIILGAVLFIAINILREIQYYKTIVSVFDGNFSLIYRAIGDTEYDYFANKVIRLIVADFALYLFGFLLYKNENTRKFILYFIIFQWVVLVPVYLLLHHNFSDELSGFLTNFRILLFNGFLTVVMFVLLIASNAKKSKTLT